MDHPSYVDLLFRVSDAQAKDMWSVINGSKTYAQWSRKWDAINANNGVACPEGQHTFVDVYATRSRRRRQHLQQVAERSLTSETQQQPRKGQHEA